MFENDYYSISDVAKITKLTDRTIRNYLSNGTLKGQKIGGQWRFTKENIKALFKEQVFEEDISSRAKKYLNDYYDNKLQFNHNNSSAVINITLKENVEIKDFYTKLRAIAIDEDLKFKISFIDDNNPRKIKLVVISSLEYLFNIMDIIKEYIV